MNLTKSDMIEAIVLDELDNTSLRDAGDILFTLWCERMEWESFTDIQQAYKDLQINQQLH